MGPGMPGEPGMPGMPGMMPGMGAYGAYGGYGGGQMIPMKVKGSGTVTMKVTEQIAKK